MSHSSQWTREPAYYIEDCLIFVATRPNYFLVKMNFLSYCERTTAVWLVKSANLLDNYLSGRGAPWKSRTCFLAPAPAYTADAQLGFWIQGGWYKLSTNISLSVLFSEPSNSGQMSGCDAHVGVKVRSERVDEMFVWCRCKRAPYCNVWYHI